MKSPEWKRYWKELGRERRLRRQIMTAQRTLEKADREAARIGFITPTSAKAFQKLRDLGEQHLAVIRRLGEIRARLPKK